jgi:hypothetical protein
MRVLLANDPRSCREIFAGAFRVLRPHLEVITAEPEALEEVASRLRPDAVVCSNTTPELRTTIGAWLEVRLEDGLLRVRASDTGRSQDPDPGLEILLEFVDRSEESRKARGERVESKSEKHHPGGCE